MIIEEREVCAWRFPDLGCGNGMENLIHVHRNCKEVRTLWLALFVPLSCHASPLKDW